MTDAQTLLSHLKTYCNGMENRYTADWIADALGWTPRKVGEVAHEPRRQGQPVCSTCRKPAGYWWPTSQEEIEITIREYGARIANDRRALNGVLIGYRKLFGKEEQMSLLEVSG